MITFFGLVGIGLLAALIARVEHLAGEVKALRSDIAAFARDRRPSDEP